ncbi:MAG: DUF554 domain-containing protein [Clostridia bacterium]|nr:DUF554 domain-containing protein [Clostridia bacterium]
MGTLVNFFTVLISGTLGALVKKSVSKSISDAIMSGMAICVIYIGIDGMLEAAPAVTDESSFLTDGLVKVLVMILSLAIGTLIGELINIDKWVGRLGDVLESKLVRGEGANGNFSRGFVSCSLLFCVGAMTVNGAIADAAGNPYILIAKSVIDAIACFIMSTTYGIGCAFSAFFVLVYQGLISLLGMGLVEILPPESITYMSVTGSLVIILVGLNVLGCTKVKTANMIPAIFMPIALWPLLELIL